MKTTKLFSFNIRNGFIALSLVLCLVTLIFNACKKDEPLQISDTSSQAGSNERNAPNEIVNYEMIDINHVPGHGPMVDYQVQVFSNGTIVYIGRSNVSVIGKKIFSVDLPTINNLRMMFMNISFFTIRVNDNPIPDAPITYTTFSNGSKPRTIVDYGDGTPESVYKVRTAVEDMLHISQFVYGKE